MRMVDFAEHLGVAPEFQGFDWYQEVVEYLRWDSARLDPDPIALECLPSPHVEKITMAYQGELGPDPAFGLVEDVLVDAQSELDLPPSKPVKMESVLDGGPSRS